MQVRSVWRSAIVAGGVALLAACAATAKKKQLEDVAKDWCLVVRASQVIPVYPLTEDLEPGDVLLVRTPIATQQQEYLAKGFLPLDAFVTRLHPKGYKDFYEGAYGISDDDKTRPPHVWQFPASGSKTPWDPAPHAAFPSYSFSVQAGGGLSLAIPVQGVPVALSLLGAQSADGTVTLSDAYTYGLDEVGLRAQLDAWAKAHPDVLRSYAPAGPDATFLRVVARVYLTGRVNVVVNAASTFGGTASGGAPKSVDLLDAQQSDRYQKSLDALNKALDTTLPGATVKVASASNRSVSLVETFARPLVIGYVGFDVPIEAGGRLGTTKPTQSQLTGTPIVATTEFGDDPNTGRINRWLKAPGNRDRLAEWLQTKSIDRSEIPNIVYGADRGTLRAEIVEHFHITE